MIYLDLVMILNFLVDLFLLLATNKLCGYPLGIARATPAAIFGGVYAGICMVPGFRFLGSTLWRGISLISMASIAFGWNRSLFRRGILFLFLSMALGGIATCIGKGGFLEVAVSAVVLFALTAVGFRGRIGGSSYVDVMLLWKGQQITLTALQDTGNTLKDPVTGKQILIVGPEIAWDVLGLTPGQLQQPIEAMQQGRIPGLRLVPYRSVGQSAGMLLAVKFDCVKINGEEQDQLVAFSPNSFGRGANYQALTGGNV